MKEKTIENAWSILLKFGKEENLQKLQAGQFYMKNLQYYVDLEKGTSDEDVGDMYDGQMMLQDVKMASRSSYSGFLLKISKRYHQALLMQMVSLVVIPLAPQGRSLSFLP